MLSRDDTGLIVVDIQGKLANIVHDSEKMIPNTLALIKGAKVLNLPILWLEQNPEKLGATIPEISNALTPLEPIAKYTFDGCGSKLFDEAVKQSNVNQWLVCGIETHICVYQTVSSLIQRGYAIELVSDCVSSRRLSNKELAISKLAAKGVGMTSVEMCLYELVGDCRASEFREILRLIR